jgi:hypothetical protein
MATLAEFRVQYPQYDNVPDLKLADSLYDKFYSKMPKMDFYKSIGIGADALIPGNENAITLPKPEASLRDKIMGAVEAPAIVASGIGQAVATPLAKMYGEAVAGQGTPQGKAAGEAAARSVASQFYQPRTQSGPEYVNAISGLLEAMPPTFGAAGNALNALAPAAMKQAGSIVRPAINQMATAGRTAEPAMIGVGAANTAEDLMRQQRLDQFGIRSTQGERTKNLAQQQFESEVQRGVVTGISEDAKTKLAEQVRNFKANQKQDIVNNFERMTSEVGAEVADPSQVTQVGRIVDKALNDEYTKKFNAYKALYKTADESGETLQTVPYQSLLDYINTKTPTARQKLDPILDSVAESLTMNDPGKTGAITVRALEDIYQQIGQVKNSPNAGKLKQIITDMGEGAGGELYQAARASRRQLAKEFEDVSRVDKLLSTKAGYTDRRVELEKVFKHIVLDAPFEEMRTVTSLLKKAGPEGRQAYAELQGQTLQHMKELLTQGDQMSFKNLNTFINQLGDEKLTYMFGKTGRDQILDLRNAIKDVVVKEPGAVNYSNTSGAVLRGLEALQSLKVPGASKIAELARTREVSQKVGKALEQPNQLAPAKPNKNSLLK